MSGKNKLQEYCQKNNYEMPKYNTVRIGGGDHNPKFECTLLCLNKIFRAINNSKKSVEEDVAQIANKYLSESKNKDNNINMKQKIIVKQKVLDVTEINFDKYQEIYLVDADNQDLTDKDIKLDKIYLFFVAKNTTKNYVFRFQDSFNNCYAFISESVGRDASDHLLTFTLGKLSMIVKNKNYYIVTKDHYGEFLETFCKNAKFLCNIE